jgi:tetratricopeptide (TPR) repeat protein
MVENVVSRLAEMRQADVALKTVEKAIEASPLETPLHRIRILLEIGGAHWKEAAAHSEELAKLDTAAVDSAFFVRLSVAYRNDSQPAKALDAIERATKKFPNNAFFRVLLGQEYARNGDQAKAVEEYKKALQLDPKLPRVRTFIASGFNQLNEPDSTLVWLRAAHGAQEDTATIAGMARAIGGKYLQSAQQTKTREDYEKAIPALAFADTVSASDQTKWFWAVAAYGIAGGAVTLLQTAPTCELARLGEKYLDVATGKIREGGGRAGGETAGQIMQGASSAIPYVQGMITQHCRP